jgi:hypothetical protein
MVSHIDGSTWIKPAVEKVPRPQTKDGIFVPQYAARLIRFFVENIRPFLKPKKGVLSIWISSIGTPLQGGSYNNRIQKAIIGCFGINKITKKPHKHITPQTFQRLIPSLLFALDIHPDGVSMKDFIACYA